MSFFAKSSRIAICLASTTALTPVWAQQAPSAAGPGFDEIVITAEKRGSTVQKAPVSITAISGEALQEQGAGLVGTRCPFVDNLTNKTALLGNTGALSANVAIFQPGDHQ